VIWGAVLLMVILVWSGAVGWYASRRQAAATTEDQRRRFSRQAVAFSAAVGVAILISGVVVFVVTGYNWLVLALVWAFGLLHLGLLAGSVRRVRKRTGRL
jgi:cell division protein FtsW (lipid II flippase)